jgi:hypothetical protein
MATKKSIGTKRKIVKRRKTTKSVLPKILIGTAVIGGGYYLYKYVIKPYLQSGSQNLTNTPTVTGITADGIINEVISSASATTPNIPSAGAGQTFSPIGTAWEALDKTTPIKYGSKGQEVATMQKLINDIAKAKGWKTRVNVDGIFGQNTWNLHKVLSFQAQNLNYWYNAKEKAVQDLGNQLIFGTSYN